VQEEKRGAGRNAPTGVFETESTQNFRSAQIFLEELKII